MDANNMIQALQRKGYRVTEQRKAICELLAGSDEHPSAQMVYERLKPRFSTLSLATVYNTLDVLAQMGAINVLGAVGGDAIRYDADMEPHINLACIACHRISDVESRHVKHLNGEITAASGYQLLGARVLYYGVCPECQAKRQPGVEKQAINNRK